MRRLTVCVLGIALGAVLYAGAAVAEEAMTPTAPQKMMPPAEKARMEACQKKAAQQNIQMDERAKFIMDCMKEMAK